MKASLDVSEEGIACARMALLSAAKLLIEVICANCSCEEMRVSWLTSSLNAGHAGHSDTKNVGSRKWNLL